MSDLNRINTVLVVGAGGNIGSHLVPLVARMPQVGRLVLIDSGIYEARDMEHQDIMPGDVGKGKAHVQARRAKRLRPGLVVAALACRVEDIPLGKLRADLTLSCLDTKVSRQYCNEFVHHLGQPWIDAGVSADGLLIRLNSFRPGPGTACLECSWDQNDYNMLEQLYVCMGETESWPTNAPACLGSAAASLQALEASKILFGCWDETLIGKQMLLDGRFHHQFVSKMSANPLCRFDHRVWEIEPVGKSPQEITVEETLGWTGQLSDAVMRVMGQSFSLKRTCPGCGRSSAGIRLTGRPPQCASRCRFCKGRVATAGQDTLDYLCLNSGRSVLGKSLADLGVLPHDIIAVGQGSGSRYFELGMDVRIECL